MNLKIFWGFTFIYNLILDIPVVSDIDAVLAAAISDVSNELGHNPKLSKIDSSETLADAKIRRENLLKAEIIHPPLPPPLPSVSCAPNPPPPPPSGYTSQTSYNPYVGPTGYHTTASTSFTPPPSYSFASGVDEGQLSAGQLNLSDSDLRTKFPVLYSQNYFVKNPAFVYLKMESLAKQEIECSNRLFTAPKTLLDKLQANNENIVVPTEYAAAIDDYQYNLHPVRYARFPITPPTQLFTMAANLNINPPPITSYDFSHLKNVHQVTPNAYIESHNLMSQRLSLKMFTESNFLKASSGFQQIKIVDRQDAHAELQTGASLLNVKSFHEFLSSFFWARVLRSCAFPLDKSFDSLYLFFLDNDFFECPYNADGLGRGPMNQGTFCAVFADYIIQMNNSRYAKKMPFATTTELHSIFVQFCRGDQRFKNHCDRSATPQSPRKVQSRSLPNKKSICMFFNSKDKTCFRSKMNEGKNCRDKSGFIYKHMCDFQLANGEICGKFHAKFEHPT